MTAGRWLAAALLLLAACSRTSVSPAETASSTETSMAGPPTVALDTLAPTSELGTRLQAHVRFLAAPELQGRKPGTEGNRTAARYVVDRFREVGLEPLPSLGGFGQPLPRELGDNLLGARWPRGRSSGRFLLLGAHYDHLGGRYLGADDNASAVAILIETARLLPALTRHPVLFAAFNAEEPPYIRTPLMGSQYFVDHLPGEIGRPDGFQAAVIMDLMGGAHWPPLRDTVFACGAEASPELYARLKASLAAPPLMPDSSPLTVLPLGMHLVEEIPLVGQVAFSDYDAFRNVSVPYVFLSAGRTPRYHRPSDLPDTLHYERMAATVRWLVALLLRLDEDEAAYGFDPKRLAFADEVAALRPLVRAAARWESRIPGTSPVSLAKMKADERWLNDLRPEQPTAADVKRLERLSIRMQCLLADMYGCLFI